MKKIAILGASYLQLPLVLKARELGHITHCFAWDNEDAVCKNEADFFYPVSVLDTEQILDICTKIKIDGIITIATDICIPVIAHIAEKLNLVSNSKDTAFKSTNKLAMRETFQKNNIRSPKYIAVAAYHTNDYIGFSYPLIVKPTDRSGSRGVSKVQNPEELEIALQKALEESIEKKAVVEEFIEGAEISVECISWQGNHYLLAITDKVTTGAPHFVELQHHQPGNFSAEMQQKIKTVTFENLDALGISFGASHSEFKINAKGEIFAIETGARMGGDFIGSHLVALSTGYDFLKGVIDVALNNFAVPKTRALAHSGVYFLAEESAFLLPYFSQDNSFDHEKKQFKETLSKISNSNDRSGYLIYQDIKKIELQ